MSTNTRTNEAMLNGRTFADMAVEQRRLVDQTPVGDAFLLIQNLRALQTTLDAAAELKHAGGSNHA
jgi:hypothetical protein